MSNRTPTAAESNNFWRCRKCAKVNFRSATLCSGCDTPSISADGDNNNNSNSNVALSPASMGYLRSTAAVAVNAKVSNLQEMLEDQRKKYERDIVTLRKQLDTALNAHNSLLSSQRQYMARPSGGGNNNNSTSSSNNASSSGAGASSSEVAALESGYQQQIAMLQQQQQEANKARDEANSEVSALKNRLDELVGKCESAATEYAGAMNQLEESEQARNSLLEKLNSKPAAAEVQPPVPGTVGSSSSAVKNLEAQVGELAAANASLKFQVEEMQGKLLLSEREPSGSNLTSSTVGGSTNTLTGTGGSSGAAALAAAAGPAPASTSSVENLRAAICAKLGVASAADLAQVAPHVDAGLQQIAEGMAALLRDLDTARSAKDSLQRRWEESEREIEDMEATEKEKATEWERERESLKKKLAAVEKDVQEADSRERDAVLTMNAMDAILSDSLWALKQQQHSGALG